MPAPGATLLGGVEPGTRATPGTREPGAVTSAVRALHAWGVLTSLATVPGSQGPPAAVLYRISVPGRGFLIVSTET